MARGWVVVCDAILSGEALEPYADGVASPGFLDTVKPHAPGQKTLAVHIDACRRDTVLTIDAATARDRLVAPGEGGWPRSTHLQGSDLLVRLVAGAGGVPVGVTFDRADTFVQVIDGAISLVGAGGGGRRSVPASSSSCREASRGAARSSPNSWASQSAPA